MNIERQVFALADDHSGYPAERMNPSKTLTADLGMDSLDCMEFTMDLEDQFGIEIADDTADAFQTLQDVIDHITKVKS